MNIKIAMVLALVGIMTPCLVITKPLANHAFAATACSLTLKADPGSGSLATGESIDQKISGTLTCGGTGLGGATIQLGLIGGVLYSKTDSSGNYHETIPQKAGTSLILSARYPGDSEHSKTSISEIILLKEKNSGGFTPG
jgi:hypothetical protein